MTFHQDCFVCGPNGFLIRDYTTGPDGALSTEIDMDGRTEGWIGIPHGGFGMGAMMELISFLPAFPGDPSRIFPVTADFRMGGAQVFVGDTVSLSAKSTDNGAFGMITKEGQPHPYISGDFTFCLDNPQTKSELASFLPNNISDMTGRLIPLPFYRNCFVCGVDRKFPGLRRMFQLFEDDQKRIAVSLIGFDKADRDTVGHFRRGNTLHPIALLALGDETMGWGAFFLSKNGGVSVRLSYTFYREIRTDERIVVFGKGLRTKGEIEKRMMFWATGGAAAVKPNGTFEIVMASSGQWLALPALTVQMRNNLIPEELTAQAFEKAQIASA
jgi:hypothetical protein